MSKPTGHKISLSADENICINRLCVLVVCPIKCVFFIIYKYIENILSYFSPPILGYPSP